jgi:hypothetical protein
VSPPPQPAAENASPAAATLVSASRRIGG